MKNNRARARCTAIRMGSCALAVPLRDNFYFAIQRLSSQLLTSLLRSPGALLSSSFHFRYIPCACFSPLSLFADARGSPIIRNYDRQRHLLSWLLYTVTLITPRNSKVPYGKHFPRAERVRRLRRGSSKGSCVVPRHNNAIECCTRC